MEQCLKSLRALMVWICRHRKLWKIQGREEGITNLLKDALNSQRRASTLSYPGTCL